MLGSLSKTFALTQRRASGGKGRGGACSQSAGQMLEVDLGRLEGRCRLLYYRWPARPRNVSPLWMDAGRPWIGEEPGSGSGLPHPLGLEHSVWHWREQEIKVLLTGFTISNEQQDHCEEVIMWSSMWL